jgi:hypothetical protein
MDAKRPLGQAELRDFPGLVLNIDPDDLKPGASQAQVNVTSARPAALEVRPGFRPVKFEDTQ